MTTVPESTVTPRPPGDQPPDDAAVRIGIAAPREIQISRPEHAKQTVTQEVSAQETTRENSQFSLAFCGTIS